MTCHISDQTNHISRPYSLPDCLHLASFYRRGTSLTMMTEGITQLEVPRQYSDGTKSLASRSEDPYGLRLSNKYNPTSGAVVSSPYVGIYSPHDHGRSSKANRMNGKSGELKEVNETGMRTRNDSEVNDDFRNHSVGLIIKF